jgi:ParB-like chromosome segregation protein Spo0J
MNSPQNETDDEASTPTGEVPAADTPATEPALARRPIGSKATRPQDLPLAMLRPHPKNPRVVYRKEVVDKIAAELRRAKKFLPQYALTVRPIGDGLYEIISGHQRCEAAKAAEIKKGACWVVEYDDNEAFIELLLANSQAEVSPLEIGLHCLDALATGAVETIKEYADRVHMERANVSAYQKGAAVLRVLGDRITPGEWLDKALHLAQIANASKEKWLPLAERCLKEKWSARQTRAEVTRLTTPPGEKDDGGTAIRRIAFGEDIDISTASAVLTLPSLRVRFEPVRDALGAISAIRVLKPGELMASVTVESVPVVSGSVVSAAASPAPKEVPATSKLISISPATVDALRWVTTTEQTKKRLRLLGANVDGAALEPRTATGDFKDAFTFVAGARADELRSILRNRKSVVDASMLLAGFRPFSDIAVEHPERVGAVVLAAYGEPRAASRNMKVQHVAVGWIDAAEARLVSVYSFVSTLGLVLDHPVNIFDGGGLGAFIGAWWVPA